MEPIGKQIQKIFTKAGISDSEVLGSFTCDGCRRPVVHMRMYVLGGPRKGEPFEEYVGCQCADIEAARQLLKEKEIKKRRILFDEQSLINPDLQSATFETYEPTHESQRKAKALCMEYAQSFSTSRPGNLILSGAYGLGKSHLSVAISKTVMDQGYSSIFISVPKLLTKIKRTYHQRSNHSEDQLLQELERVDVLILDDIGAEQIKRDEEGNSWAESKLFEIIDNRMGKATVFTTNLSAKELSHHVGPRIFSRLIHKAESLKLEGDDYRMRGR